MILLAASLLASVAPALPVAQRKSESVVGSQIPAGRPARIGDLEGASERVRGRVLMSEFVRCAVDRRASRLDDVMAAADAGFGTAIRQLVTKDCLRGGRMKFKPLAMRGPLFVELYRRKAQASDGGRSWGPASAKVDLAAAPAGEAERKHLALMSLSSCVVQKDRAAAEAVVLAPTASKRQDVAIGSIAPVFGACLPQNSQIRLSKELVEAGLAEILYRGVKPAAAPLTASGTRS